MGRFKELCIELEEKIQKSYEEGVTMESAEKLAGEFLVAQLRVSEELKSADLDSRLRKTGVKAVRAAIYLDIVQRSEKKPTEAQIEATINTDKIVGSEQESFDKAEVERDNLERYYNVFREAHQHFRIIAKGRFE